VQQDLCDRGAAALGDRDAIDRGLDETKRRDDALLVGRQDDLRPEPGERGREETIRRHEPHGRPQTEAEVGHGSEADAKHPLRRAREDGEPAAFSGLFERDLEATWDEGRRRGVEGHSLDRPRHAQLALPGSADTKRRALLQTVTPEPLADIDLHVVVSASPPKLPALERRPIRR
jgi:hypothetical protein